MPGHEATLRRSLWRIRHARRKRRQFSHGSCMQMQWWKKEGVEKRRWAGMWEWHGCQMAIARFLDHMCLALRASGLWLRYAALQNLPSGNTGEWGSGHGAPVKEEEQFAEMDGEAFMRRQVKSTVEKARKNLGKWRRISCKENCVLCFAGQISF